MTLVELLSGKVLIGGRDVTGWRSEEIARAGVGYVPVRELAATGASVLVVEQRARAVLEISDRTYVLGGGQLRMEGTPAELGASSEFVDSFLGGTPHRV